MAYNKFRNIEQLATNFGIKTEQWAWLPKNIPIIQPSDLLAQQLIQAETETLRTEKAKSEYVIAPIISEIRRKNIDKISTYSGFELIADKLRGLTGFCDFILAAVPRSPHLSAPIFCLVEAKKDDIDAGIAQCGAEMYAAQLYNERAGTPRPVIFGCVTNAFSWCFLKLDHHQLYIDPNYVPLTFTEPQRVVAVLQWILDESL
jgi:hypothetical protein